MSGFVWRNGDLNTFQTKLQIRAEGVRGAALELVTASALEGKARMREIIEAETTDTGFLRQATSGKSSKYGSTHPGRVDSGKMLDGVDEHHDAGLNLFTAKWGWFDPEDYFKFQENGTEHIKAMHALLQSYIETRIKFLHDVNQLAKSGRLNV